MNVCLQLKMFSVHSHVWLQVIVPYKYSIFLMLSGSQYFLRFYSKEITFSDLSVLHQNIAFLVLLAKPELVKFFWKEPRGHFFLMSCWKPAHSLSCDKHPYSKTLTQAAETIFCSDKAKMILVCQETRWCVRVTSAPLYM